MPFAAIPNELVLAIADFLPTREFSLLSRTNSTLSHLLTPPLFRRARKRHFARCIIKDRLASLLALLRTPNSRFNIEDEIRYSPTQPLHYAAQNCSPALVAAIIALGVPVDDASPTPTLTTTLQHAVFSCNNTTVTIILDAGADINRASVMTRFPPLALACTIDRPAIAHILICRGAHLAPDVLARAAVSGMLSVVQRLLDLGVPVDATHVSMTMGGRSLTALQCVCMRSHRVEVAVVEVLLRAGADPNVGVTGEMMPLYSCVLHNDLEGVRVLVGGGADPDVMCGGRSLLELADLWERCEMVHIMRGRARG